MALGIGASFSHALSVGKGPGATALTRMLWRPHSTASDIVIACTAVLAITDGSTYGEPVQTHVTSMLTTEPGSPCAIQRRPQASVA